MCDVIYIRTWKYIHTAGAVSSWSPVERRSCPMSHRCSGTRHHGAMALAHFTGTFLSLFPPTHVCQACSEVASRLRHVLLPMPPLPRLTKHPLMQVEALKNSTPADHLLLMSHLGAVLCLSRPCLFLQVFPGDRVSSARGYPPEDGRAVLGQLRAVLARQELRPPWPRPPGELQYMSQKN